ncbi:MAG: tetratricopeptide repeat protein [Planctomycetota bacterium]
MRRNAKTKRIAIPLALASWVVALSGALSLTAADKPAPARPTSQTKGGATEKQGLTERELYDWRRELLELDQSISVSTPDAARIIVSKLDALGKRHIEPSFYRTLARASIRADLRQRAADADRRYLETAPNDAAVREELGLILQSLSDTTGALEQFRLALTIDDKRELARQGRAVIHFNLGDVAAALEDFSKLIAQGVQRADVLRGAAYSALASEPARYDVALECLRRLVPAEPDNPRIRLLMAECLYHLGRYDEVVELLASELIRFPDDAAILRLLADARLGVGDYGGAIDAWRSLSLARPLTASEMRSLADCCLTEGLPREAADLYARILDLSRSGESHDTDITEREDNLRYAEALAAAGFINEAESRYAVALSFSGLSDMDIARLDMRVAQMQLDANHPDRAELTLKRVVARSPLTPPAWLYLGDIAFDAGRLDDAADAYRFAARVCRQQTGLDDLLARAEAGLGDVAFTQKDYETALGHYASANALRPTADAYRLAVERVKQAMADVD